MAKDSLPAFSAQPKRVLSVALYGRVSTTSHGQDVDLQLAELRQLAARRGFTISEEYVDHVSGSKETRPALQQLMAAAHRRQFDAVLVWKLDRWGRSLKHLVNSLAELESLGIAFISVTDNLDLSTPAGRLMFHIIGAMAQFERSLIQERVRAGLRNAKVKGKKIGRPRASAIVDQGKVRELRAAGQSWRQIAGALNVNLRTLHRDASGFELAWENPGRRAQDGGAL